MLRRRLPRDNDRTSTPDQSQDRQPPTPDTNDDDDKDKQIVLKPRSKRRNGFIFFLGGVFGIFIALFFANQQEVISLDSLMDLNLDALIDVIPQGIVKDAREFSVGLLLHWDVCGLFVCRWLRSSNMNEKPSATTPSPSASTSNPRVSKPSTPS